MIIGLAGKAGVGKSTVARHITTRYGMRRRAFADPLKEAAMVMFALGSEQVFTQQGKAEVDPRWDMTPRQMLQQLGAYGRSIQSDFWVRRAFLNPTQRGVVFDDVRFQNEVDAVRNRGGIVILLERPGIACDDPDPSENQRLSADYTLVNDSDLRALLFSVDAVLASKGLK